MSETTSPEAPAPQAPPPEPAAPAGPKKRIMIVEDVATTRTLLRRILTSAGYDVIEVETRYLKNPRGYDTSGLPFHRDNQTVIKERFYLDKTDPNTMYDAITVIDHAMTRPYSIVKKAIRNPNPRPVWHTEVCEDTNVWIRIGEEPYYLSADGKLMPSRKGQAPPDLRYFEQTKK